MINTDVSTLGEIASIDCSTYVTEATKSMAARFSKFVVTPEQLSAWKVGFNWIHEIATAVLPFAADWIALPEYAAPLVSGRPDLVVISPRYFFVIEMKTGISGISSVGEKQVLDYAQTLWGKLRAARQRQVVSIVMSSAGKDTAIGFTDSPSNSFSNSVLKLSPTGVTNLFLKISGLDGGKLRTFSEEISDLIYSPRPSVVEAATALVASTEDKNVITGLSSADEIENVAKAIRALAERASTNSEHILIVVTGPPGSGKTLVGLRLAHDRSLQSMLSAEHGSPLYLTGNGPLVEVLVESLARDEVRRRGISKETARASADSKVRLIHGITEDSLGIDANVIIFDEGQRVWDAERMRLKKGDSSLGSEAEEVLSYMESHRWSLVVVLLGEGQEINKGEAGLKTWVEAVASRAEKHEFDWTILTPEAIVQSTSNVRAESNAMLRLKVVRRTDNAADVSSWATNLLSNNFAQARSIREEFSDFPIFLTRDLEEAKAWLRQQSSLHAGRRGLLASSKSKRLFLYGVDVVADADRSFSAANWYLNSLPDLSSSDALELAATEFKCQGLELDWVGLCWSWDMVLARGNWTPRTLNTKESVWKETHGIRRDYQINSYRVLLTRARRGLVIWVPKGEPGNSSMAKKEMDEVAEALLQVGVKRL